MAKKTNTQLATEIAALQQAIKLIKSPKDVERVFGVPQGAVKNPAPKPTKSAWRDEVRRLEAAIKSIKSRDDVKKIFGKAKKKAKNPPSYLQHAHRASEHQAAEERQRWLSGGRKTGSQHFDAERKRFLAEAHARSEQIAAQERARWGVGARQNPKSRKRKKAKLSNSSLRMAQNPSWAPRIFETAKEETFAFFPKQACGKTAERLLSTGLQPSLNTGRFWSKPRRARKVEVKACKK